MEFYGHQANTAEDLQRNRMHRRQKKTILIMSLRKNKERAGSRGKLRKNHIQ